ncbi:hypothetical protein [Streptomyces longwoodensis]|uniref:hypothetical protein n=1 Tax=Streptomyces longwoodensis TaxID=68231 RepID=UPI000B30E4C6|nr:hypothetical protein [Streptomyces longwoodensis]
MGCNCGSKRQTTGAKTAQYEVVEGGRRVFGPTPYKATAQAVANKVAGREVREVGAS